jgi:hypothetical protein
MFCLLQIKIKNISSYVLSIHSYIRTEALSQMAYSFFVQAEHKQKYSVTKILKNDDEDGVSHLIGLHLCMR